MARWVPFHDLMAGIATVILLAGILLLLVLQQPIPQFLSHALIGALTWTFRGGVQLQNELRHRNRQTVTERLKALGYSDEDAEAIRKVFNGS